MEDGRSQEAICPECGGQLEERVVQVAIWRDNGFVVIDQVPARACAGCGEQFYDDTTASAMRRLVASSFPDQHRAGEVTVPVYRLEHLAGAREPQTSQGDV